MDIAMTESTAPAPTRMQVRRNNPVLRLLIISALIFAAFSLVLRDQFFSVRNMQSMAVQFPEFGILAIAIMITMVTGGIDLSIVGIANLSGILAALTMQHYAPDGSSPMWLMLVAVGVALVVGSLCGLLNGFLVARIGIPPILATLGSGSLYTGFGYVITGGYAVRTAQMAVIGNGSVLGIPYPVIIFALAAALFAVILNRTTFGFNVYMLGTNTTAARFSGIRSALVLIRTYWLAGLLGAVAGIIFLARANSAKPDYGSTFVLLSVLISILGGVSYTGGFGTIGGLVLAVLSIQFLSTGLNMLMLQLSGSSAAIFFRQFAWGALLLGVMVLNYYSQKRQSRSPG